jgi:hypothetical protein
MKTSIKMLLGFAGIVLLLVLASDVVLWAYFKKGINGDGTALQFPGKAELYKEKISDLRPFKTIVINSDNVWITNTMRGDSIGIKKDGDEVTANYYRQVGDTLYILPVQQRVTVYCNSVQYIRLAADSLHLNISRLHQPVLEIHALNDCYLDLGRAEVGNFTYKGGENNRIMGNQKSKFDTVDVQLGEYGSIDLQDGAIKNFILKADKMREFSMDELVLLNLTQFKRK